MEDTPEPVVPNLRFPQFCDDGSWITPRLADLYSFKRTNALSRENLNYELGAVRNIHYGDIHTKFKAIFRLQDERVPYVNPEAAPGGFSDDVLCEEGDIVLADASEDLEAVGKAIEIVSLDGEHVVAGTHTILATRRGGAPAVGFGGQLFQSATVRVGIKREAQGAKVFGISANRISAIPVPIPPTVAEQQRIADCLDSLDELIVAENRKLDALRCHRQGLLQTLLPRIDESEPRTRLSKFRNAQGWKQRKLSDLVERADARVVVDPGMEYREIGVRSHGKGVFHKAPVAGSVLGSKRVFHVIENALVFNIVFAWERAVATVSKREAGMIASHRFPMYLPKGDQSDVRFLKYAFLTQRGAQLLHVASPGGAGRNRTLGQSELLGLPMLAPSRAEQTAIAEVMEASEALIDEQVKACDLIRFHKRGLLQRMFPEPTAI